MSRPGLPGGEADPASPAGVGARPARVLVVAGSDSGAGAGIQADLKTVTCLGGYAATALTALTAQNTKGVQGILPVPVAFVLQQIRSVLTDIGADILKIGMLGTPDLIEALAQSMEPGDAPGEIGRLPVVLDPVMVAKGGSRLLEPVAVDALRASLIPRVHVLTPNVPEAETLLDRGIDSDPAMEQACLDLASLGASPETSPLCVVLKGGHFLRDDGQVVDFVFDGRTLHRLACPRIDSKANHGTGCTLASAVAVGLAQGMDLLRAAQRAQAYVGQAMRQAWPLGSGPGPMNHHVQP